MAGGGDSIPSNAGGRQKSSPHVHDGFEAQFLGQDRRFTGQVQQLRLGRGVI